DVGVFLLRTDREHALVAVARRKPVHLRARHRTHRYADSPAFRDNIVHATIVALTGHGDIFEFSPARLQRFADRIDAVNDRHGISLAAGKRVPRQEPDATCSGRRPTPDTLDPWEIH